MNMIVALWSFKFLLFISQSLSCTNLCFRLLLQSLAPIYETFFSLTATLAAPWPSLGNYQGGGQHH